MAEVFGYPLSRALTTVSAPRAYQRTLRLPSTCFNVCYPPSNGLTVNFPPLVLGGPRQKMCHGGPCRGRRPPPGSPGRERGDSLQAPPPGALQSGGEADTGPPSRLVMMSAGGQISLQLPSNKDGGIPRRRRLLHPHFERSCGLEEETRKILSSGSRSLSRCIQPASTACHSACATSGCAMSLCAPENPPPFLIMSLLSRL